MAGIWGTPAIAARELQRMWVCNSSPIVVARWEIQRHSTSTGSRVQERHVLRPVWFFWVCDAKVWSMAGGGSSDIREERPGSTL